MAAAVFRGPFRALASPRFTVYWVAQGISVVADRAYLVAFALQLGVVEGRSDLLALALAANGIAFALPMVLLGAVVDRIGRGAGSMPGAPSRLPPRWGRGGAAGGGPGPGGGGGGGAGVGG